MAGKIGASGEPVVRQMVGANDIEATTLAKKFLPIWGIGQVGTTKS